MEEVIDLGNNLDLGSIRDSQMRESEWAALIQYLEGGTIPQSISLALTVRSEASKYVVKDGMLSRKGSNTPPNRLCLPPAHQDDAAASRLS